MGLELVAFEGRELLPERIAAALRKAIVEGELAPGTRLAEQDIARRFRVSRVPLREAFRVLAGEGLVSIVAHRGAIVSEVSDTELSELFAVRALFEGHAAATLAARSDPQLMQQLLNMVADMKSAVRRRRLEAYYTLAAAFHDVLVAAGGGSVIGRFYGQIRRQLRRYQAVMSRLPESPRRSILEHGQILAAIRARDATRARRAAQRHVDALVTRYRATFRAQSRKATNAIRKVA